MEPQIQYAKTSDGVNIAYYTVGEGPPLLVVQPSVLNHLQLEWEVPLMRRWLESMALVATVVRYDARGFGLSHRDVTDFSVGAMVRDIEAVADRLNLERFRILAHGDMGAVAIAYAARHAQRVSRLALWITQARGSDGPTEIYDAIFALTDKEPELGIQADVRMGLGAVDEDVAQGLTLVWRESITRDNWAMFWGQFKRWDVTDLLPSLTMPTLVAHPRQVRYQPVEVAINMAATIPDARLAIFEGSSTVPSPEAAAAIWEFLMEGAAPPPRPRGRQPSGTAVILFADIVDSTALTERLGDAAFRDKARDVAAALRSVIAEGGGRTIDGPTLGDGVLATFTSARQAIEAAQRCGKAGDDAGLPLHLGLHAGDVTREKDPDGRDNVYGGAVNIASRISGLSAPGEVLVSDTVHGLARTSAGVAFEDRGEQPLKGVGEPVRVWAVRES